MKKQEIAAIAAIAIAGCTQMQSAKAADIAETAMSAPEFSTLVKAVKAAGIAPALKAKGPLTVFAPTNAAFAKLPKAQLAELLKPANKATLVKILTYHVVPMRVTAKKALSLPSGTGVKTVEGEKFAVRKMDGKVMLDAFGTKATVIKTDIKADNGVIHAIDSVIIPPTVLKALMAN